MGVTAAAGARTLALALLRWTGGDGADRPRYGFRAIEALLAALLLGMVIMLFGNVVLGRRNAGLFPAVPIKPAFSRPVRTGRGA